jgi:NAD+ diphosphatase
LLTMTDLPPEPFFSGPGLDRADALRADPDALKTLANDPAARQLRWRDGLPELSPGGRLNWGAAQGPALFLGFDGECPCFSAIENVTADARTAFPLMALLHAVDAPLFAAALSLSRWHCRHRFCANCGQLSEIIRGGWSRRCPACGAEHYPRVDPVVIMLAEHDGRLLLGRQPHYPPGRYSALAGFVEVGETIEAAVARELFEEAGVRVANVRYVASQPWPFPSSLMIGCHADSEGDALTIDRAELDDARWFTRDEVAAALAAVPDASFQPPPKAAIARTLLERWLAA